MVIDALKQLWKTTISSIVCTGVADNTGVVQAVALIKHSAYANEKMPPSSLQVNHV